MTPTGKTSPLAKEIARDLFTIGSVNLNVENPFTWASGIKSPIYCDNRRINSFVEVRRKVVNAFVELIKSEFPDTEVIAGVATGGIPMGALIAEELNLPFIYVRDKPKEHGMRQQVEGHAEQGAKVVMIEDLVSTGGSSMKAVTGVRNFGLELLGLISIMTYRFKAAEELFSNENVNYYSICDLDAIVDVAKEDGRIALNQVDLVLQFRNDPKNWRP